VQTSLFLPFFKPQKAITHRALIVSAATQNNAPAVYTSSGFVRDGGLLSYGTDQVDLFRRAASYVDRILRGEKPGDLPVQLPTKFEMIVNRKTATALGLAIPPSILLGSAGIAPLSCS
jgi:putative ABC transport system substrate-binding protein